MRIETSPEDIHGMQVAEGILTARGGMTSHAAVVARGMGKCCVAGCSALEIDYAAGTLSANGKVIHRGEYLTLDGTAGEVIEGRVPTVEPVMSPFFKKFLRGPTPSATSACAPTPTRRTTRKSRANSAPKESGCAAPSTCSSHPSESRRCAR